MKIVIKLFNRIVSKTTNIILEKYVFRIWNMLYEQFHNDYILLSASVTPLNHNWGDDVSKILVEFLTSGKKVIVKKYSFNCRNKDDYSCIGSIITWMTTCNTIIWGSGVVYPHKPISAIPKKVLAVRGPLTRNYLLERGIECPKVYGDPALLFPKFYIPKNKNRRYKVGIIPHFRDQNNTILDAFKGENGVLMIDVKKIHPWHLFIDQIVQCENILTSSLHGLIIADTYEVPNLWIELDGGEKKRFAFHDYLQSVGHDVPGPTIISNKTKLEELIRQCKWQPLNINLDLLMSVCPFHQN